jgi:hypothetical protein
MQMALRKGFFEPKRGRGRIVGLEHVSTPV